MKNKSALPEKRKYATSTRKEKLRFMKVLEQHDMNVSLAARKLGITRQTLAKYQSECWDEYTGIKEQVFDDVATIEARKMERSVELSIIEGKISNTFDKLIGELDRRLSDPKEAQKMYSKDLVAAINVLVPYLAEKKILLGAKFGEGQGNTTMFVQNIVQQIVNSKQNPKTIKAEVVENEGD